METFGATFAGVFASFLLWYGGQWLIRIQREKGRRHHLLQDVQKEIEDNIVTLERHMQDMSHHAEQGKGLAFLGMRLSLAFYDYAVASGDIRLVDEGKRRLIQHYATGCRGLNELASHSESMIIVGLQISASDPNRGYAFASTFSKTYRERTQLAATLLRQTLGKMRGEIPMEETKARNNSGL